MFKKLGTPEINVVFIFDLLTEAIPAKYEKYLKN